MAEDLSFIYTDDRDWSSEDAYGVFRMLSHVMAKAPDKPYYADVLRGIDFTRTGNVARAMALALLSDMPDTLSVLTEGQIAAIRSAVPVNPPFVLSRTADSSSRYAQMGILV